MPRLFRNHPGYVALSTFVLAVSIGANLLVFTVVNALWIRPLPFPQPDRVVTILPEHLGFISLDWPFFKIFEGGVAGQVITTDMAEALRPRIELAESDQELETLGVTSGYFRILGLRIRGRDFRTEDERPGAEPVAIISERLWTRRFGRRMEMIGAVLPAKPVPIRVIGVAPPGFEGARRGERADLWIPTGLVSRLAPADWSRGFLTMMVFARLGAGQTATTIEERYYETMRPQLREALKNGKLEPPRILPLTDVFGTPESRTFLIRETNSLLVVSGLTLLVLLGGCATTAALVLTHYERRRAELGLKMSLGAGRRRLVFELLRDLSLVAATGVTGGMLVAVVGTRLVPALSLPGGVNIGRLDLSLDWRVCAVAIGATVVTLLLAAALPLARSTRLRLAGELLAGASATTLGSLRIRQTFLALQVCSTIVVLVAAGLFVRAVLHGFGSAAGFDVDRTVFVSIQEGAPFLGSGAGDPRPMMVARAKRLIAALEQLPGVSEVAEGISPIGDQALGSLRSARIIRARDREYQLRVGVLRGSPNLLSTLRVPILAGRPLTAADDAAAAPHPAIVTRSLAERLWPQGVALGETVSLPQLRGGPYLVVGVASDLAFGSLTGPRSDVIVTVGPGSSAIVSDLVIRAEQAGDVAGLVRRTIKGQVVRIATGTEIVARDIGRQRLGAWFFSGFGLAALLLGVGGAFGLVAYLSESRRREFGVRLALGATMSDLVRHGLYAALIPVSAGTAAGFVIGGIVSRLFSALLVGISAIDGVAYAVVGTVMLGCSAMAALAAAWRLRRTTPADALRAI